MQMVRRRIFWLFLWLILDEAYCDYESAYIVDTTLGRGNLKHRLYHQIGCPKEELTLKCPDISDTMVIENATFTPNFNCIQAKRDFKYGSLFARTSSNVSYLASNIGRTDLRQAANRRCSGISDGKACTFNLRWDHPETFKNDDDDDDDNHKNDVEGFVEVYFRCEKRIHDCSENDVAIVDAKRVGFIRSKNYPGSYPMTRKCSWSLKAQPGQRIFLRFLDVNLREKNKGRCVDYISVYERRRLLLKMCGESETDIMLLSQSHVLEIILDTKRGRSIYPHRGILAEYWPVGCVQNPRGPSHVTYRNLTHLTYSCPRGTGFFPEVDEARTVVCDGKEWSDEINSCFPLPGYESLTPSKNNGNSISSSIGETNDRIRLPFILMLVCLVFVFFTALSIFFLLFIGHFNMDLQMLMLLRPRRQRRRRRMERGREDDDSGTQSSAINPFTVEVLNRENNSTDLYNVGDAGVRLDLTHLKQEELYMC